MNDKINKALAAGLERLSGWSDLLDEINVYPVADGDTGRNLIISLAPLLHSYDDQKDRVQSILLAARGNSGNIAAKFFSALITAHDLDSIPAAVKLGRKYAWEAVKEPIKGTMLTLFDALDEIIEKEKPDNDENIKKILSHLESSVHSTTELLPRLKEANVVDSGALGMYIFFEGYFNSLHNDNIDFRPITDTFKDKLTVSSGFNEDQEAGYCVDFVLSANDESSEKLKKAIGANQDAIILQDNDYIKVHFHTDDKAKINEYFKPDEFVKWTDDDLGSQIKEFKKANKQHAIHIMTDAAGSITARDVKTHGLTLLNSYVIAGQRCVPETHLDSDELYEMMRKGIKVSTSQASDFERHQHYSSILSRFDKVLYLCVGSGFTGNYRTAVEWKKENDPENRMTVIDTGYASGKLGLAVIITARYSATAKNADDVIKYAEKVLQNSYEYIFLEKLQYLAAGGRMSKPGAFFGDVLNIKPIITPKLEGAEKAGIARSTKDQYKFLFSHLEEDLGKDSKPVFMLQYTDNFSWVSTTLKEKIQNKYPDSEIILQPLSHTTSVHTGPGTWAVAYIDLNKIN